MRLVVNQLKVHPFQSCGFQICQPAPLLIGPATVDFGTVSALSTTTRFFAATNTLKSSILVELDVSNVEELKQTAPLSQVGMRNRLL